MEKNKRKRIDITINEEILKDFRKMCIDRDMIMSHRIEHLIVIDLWRYRNGQK